MPEGILKYEKQLAEAKGKIPLPEVYDFVPEETYLGYQSQWPLAVDIETIGPGKPPVPWFGPSELVCVGLCQSGARWAFDLREADQYTRCRSMVESADSIVFHNALYDLVWLKAAGFKIKAEIHDTMWLVALENESAPRGLEMIGPYEYPWHYPAKQPDMKKVLCYCANDALQTMAAFNNPKYAPYKEHRLYKLYQKMGPRIAEMSVRGIPVFKDRVDTVASRMEIESKHLADSLNSFAPINWGSGDQVAGYLTLKGGLGKKRTLSGKRLSVDEDVLRRCPLPEAKMLLQKRGLDKLYGTTITPLLGQVRAHGLFNLSGARTGRMSSHRMNLQNIPKEDDTGASAFRSLFGADDLDWVKMDLEGAELLVGAVEAGCTQMLEWYSQGKDLHRMMASRVLGKKPEDVTEQERTKLGKVPNFLLEYGGGVWTLVYRARTEYGVDITRAEAEAIVEEWYRTFPEFATWQDKMKLQIQYTQSVRSYFGRYRWVEFQDKHNYNVALNTAIQGTVLDLLLMGMDNVYDSLPGPWVNIVHDEVDFVIPKGSFDENEWRRVAKGIAGVHSRYPLRIECKMGPSWGETKKIFTEGAA